MRISDWSSDVCSSDLVGLLAQRVPVQGLRLAVAGALHRQRHLAAADRAAVKVLGQRGGEVPGLVGLRLQVQLVHGQAAALAGGADEALVEGNAGAQAGDRSEAHTSELQSLMRISYAVFCLQTHTH